MDALAAKSKEDPMHNRDVKMCQEIMYQCCLKLGEVDAIHGCGNDRLLDDTAKMQYFELEQKHLKSLSIHDLMLSHSGHNEAAMERGLVNSLANSGCYNSLKAYLDGIAENKMTSELKAFQCECLWRLSQWEDLDDSKPCQNPQEQFSKSRYQALQSLLGLNDGVGFNDNLDEARKTAVVALTDDAHRNSLLDSPFYIYPLLSNLRCLEELESLSTIGSNSVCLDQARKTMKGFQMMDEIYSAGSNFKYVEQVWTQRVVVLSNLQQLITSKPTDVFGSPIKRKSSLLPDVKKMLTESYANLCLDLSRNARKSNCLHVSQYSLEKLKYLLKFSRDPSGIWVRDTGYKVQFEEAKLNWASKEKQLAIYLSERFETKAWRKGSFATRDSGEIGQLDL